MTDNLGAGLPPDGHSFVGKLQEEKQWLITRCMMLLF